MSEKYSLKDDLFNYIKVKKIAYEIKEVYEEFDAELFLHESLDPFEKLELKERIYHLRDMLKKYLPQEYREAVNVLLKALPPELDNSKKDDDFGDFIYAPYSEFVSHYGCNDEDLLFSLEVLCEITKRFSSEFAIRDFINNYPDATFQILQGCSLSTHYHQRRFASEALRPKLPWAKKINFDYKQSITILDKLFSDETRYVTRSVANHLNDISKIDAEFVVITLKRWKESNKQKKSEMQYIINHALRSLVKQGNMQALEFLGFNRDPKIAIKELLINSKDVYIGEALEFELTLEAKEKVSLIVDYIISYKTKNGTQSSKVYKLKKFHLQKDDSVNLSKNHKFLANMTTRKLFAGEHTIELQINGTIYKTEKFMLKESREGVIVSNE